MSDESELMMMTNFTLLTQQTPNRAMHIDQNDMIHITWKHVTIRLNATGLIYLLRYLDDTLPQHSAISSFDIFGTPDDGYQLWIQDIGLRLTMDDYRMFKQLLDGGLKALKDRGHMTTGDILPGDLALTAQLSSALTEFSAN